MIAIVDTAEVITENEELVMFFATLNISETYSDSRDGNRKRLFSGTLQLGSKHMSFHPLGQRAFDSKLGHL